MNKFPNGETAFCAGMLRKGSSIFTTFLKKAYFPPMETNASSPTVAIVILNFNGKAYLQRFLPSVYATAYAHWDLYVVDNGSSDDSAAYLQAEEGFKAVEGPSVAQGEQRRCLIELPKNLGFAEGYNVGLRQIEADYYVLLNSDVAVPPEWLAPLIAALETDPQLAAVQPKICMETQRGSFEYSGAAGGLMDRWGYPFCRGRIFDSLEMDEGQYDRAIEVFWASGAALCTRAALFHDMGGLEGDFFAHMEEIDLCWRLKRANYKVGVVGASVVYHVGGGTLAALHPQKTYLNFRNSLLTLLRNVEGAAVWRIIFIRLLLDGVAGLRFLTQGRWGNLWAIVRAHWSFFGRIPRYWKKRKAIRQQIAKQAYQQAHFRSAGHYQGSILWAHFAKGKRRYSDLEIEEQAL